MSNLTQSVTAVAIRAQAGFYWRVGNQLNTRGVSFELRGLAPNTVTNTIWPAGAPVIANSFKRIHRRLTHDHKRLLLQELLQRTTLGAVVHYDQAE